MTTRLCIVRHGETAWNAEHRVQGQLDVPLNATGLAQAEAIARALGREKFDAIYASDLARALQTAAPIARRLSRMREWAKGDRSKTPHMIAATSSPYSAKIAPDAPTFTPIGCTDRLTRLAPTAAAP